MVGTEVLSSVHDAEIVPAEHTVLFEILAPLQQTEEGGKETLELPGVNLIHDGTHLGV